MIGIESRLLAKIQKNIVFGNAVVAVGAFFVFDNEIAIAAVLILSNIVIFSMWFNRCSRCGTPLVSRTGFSFFFLI